MTFKLPSTKYQKIFVLLLVLLSYGGSLWNNYSLDDEYVTSPQNKKVSKGLSGIKDIFTEPYVEKSLDQTAFEYRPITQLTFALEKQIFGFNPGLSHLINILFYLVVILIIYNLLIELFPDQKHLIFYILLIFAVHPLHSEVVLSLKNREEILVALFGFLAFKIALNYKKYQEVKYLYYAGLILCLGVITKVSITPFVFLIPLGLFFFKTLEFKKTFLFLTILLVVTYTIPKVLSYLLGISFIREVDFIESPLVDVAFLDRIPIAFQTLYHYLKLHVIPYPLLSYYGYNQVQWLGWSSLPTAIGVLYTASSVFCVVFFYKKSKLLVFGILCFGLFLFPFLNFLVPATGILAERFTFCAVLAFAIILVVVIDKLERLCKVRYLLSTFIILLVGGYTFLNIKRTPQWKDKITLIENDALIGENSYKLQAMLGELYQQKMNETINLEEKKIFFDRSLKAYEKAGKIYDKDPQYYNNIGVAFLTVNDYEKAIVLLTKAVELDSLSPTYHFHLGAAYEGVDKEKAKKHFKKALYLDQSFNVAKDRLEYLEKNRKFQH